MPAYEVVRLLDRKVVDVSALPPSPYLHNPVEKDMVEHCIQGSQIDCGGRRTGDRLPPRPQGGAANALSRDGILETLGPWWSAWAHRIANRVDESACKRGYIV